MQQRNIDNNKFGPNPDESNKWNCILIPIYLLIKCNTHNLKEVNLVVYSKCVKYISVFSM